MSRGLRIGSLFSGIGGLEAGLELAGVGHVAWQVEIDPFSLSVLERHWPEARRYHDVRAVDSTVLEPVDVLCGGFPCQDLSDAGKGAGLHGPRSSLWFEYLRLVRDMRPVGVVIENVPALERRGLDTVVAGLDGEGFVVEAVRLRAADVGAPHQRERLFVVAVADPAHVRFPALAEGAHDEAVGGAGNRAGGGAGDGVPAAGAGERGRAQGGVEVLPRQGPADVGVGRPPQPGLGGAAHGFPGGLDGARWPAARGRPQEAWEAPRLVAPGVAALRSQRLRALGNAVVPRCAEVAGLRLLELLDEVRGR